VTTGLPTAAVPDGPLHVRPRGCGERRWYFGGSDYFRLSWNPAVRRHLAHSIRSGGVDAAASRVTTGNLPAYAEAEARLARWMGRPCAVLTATGYLSSLVAAQALAPRSDGAVVVEGSHPCLRDAAAASGLPVEVVVQPDGLKDLCRARGWARPMLLLDGMGALNGRAREAVPWLEVLPPEGWCLWDDAHGVGTVGSRGRGTLELERVRDPRLIVAFTLSKAFGLYGGVVSGPKWLPSAVWEHSRAARGGTPIPPAYASAVPLVLDLLERDGTEWRGVIEGHRTRIFQALGALPGWDRSGHVGPVIGLAAATIRDRNRLQKALVKAGIEPPFIHYPGGPEGGLFRFSLSSSHPVSAVGRLAEVLASVYASAPEGYRVL
jgi:7-keto-8-aminopelargonate synthetase-like enzyme